MHVYYACMYYCFQNKVNTEHSEKLQSIPTFSPQPAQLTQSDLRLIGPVPPVRLNGRLNWSLALVCDAGQSAQRQNCWPVCVAESELAVHGQQDVHGEWDSKADRPHATEADPGQNYLLAKHDTIAFDNDAHAIHLQFIFK